jgi:hypothetical protein
VEKVSNLLHEQHAMACRLTGFAECVNDSRTFAKTGASHVPKFLPDSRDGGLSCNIRLCDVCEFGQPGYEE